MIHDDYVNHLAEQYALSIINKKPEHQIQESKSLLLKEATKSLLDYHEFGYASIDFGKIDEEIVLVLGVGDTVCEFNKSFTPKYVSYYMGSLLFDIVLGKLGQHKSKEYYIITEG